MGSWGSPVLYEDGPDVKVPVRKISCKSGLYGVETSDSVPVSVPERRVFVMSEPSDQDIEFRVSEKHWWVVITDPQHGRTLLLPRQYVTNAGSVTPGDNRAPKEARTYINFENKEGKLTYYHAKESCRNIRRQLNRPPWMPAASAAVWATCIATLLAISVAVAAAITTICLKTALGL